MKKETYILKQLGKPLIKIGLLLDYLNLAEENGLQNTPEYLARLGMLQDLFKNI